MMHFLFHFMIFFSLNMQQFFCACFLLLSIYSTTLILETVYEKRKDVLNKISATARSSFKSEFFTEGQS